GFLVDRFGARTVLVGGMALYGASVMLIGFVPHFWMMLPLMAVAGIANSVFHPADYSILSARITPARLGRAYAMHTLAGNIGWALAPAIVLTLAPNLGWRVTLFGLGAAEIAGAGAILWFGTSLAIAPARTAMAHGKGGKFWLVFTHRPILLCFVYFVLLATGLLGLQTFLPTVLSALHMTVDTLTGPTVTLFMLGAAAGTLAGGVLADRLRAPTAIVTVGLAGAASLVLIAGFVAMPAPMLMGAFALAGFCTGSTAPSRDLLVRQASPPGAMGKVFGFVYSGLDLGSSLAPLALGQLIDHGYARGLFVVTPIAFLAALAAATALSASYRRVEARLPSPSAAE
ncbi:MAG TPA: MFS transporter, partial [Stellaceae bacterium]|nr:MFS transporter [Stellaceae bacterium]